ncbi:DUF2141 domain-containing protein [Pseudozobellia thermophila]|uniref:Uncharacterized conserved protein, DUF2141 family n=1 Tax=Pseudozobellia thermophila TaxID=192903 RepID=A0A1M6FN95_9FLAO|nr:DUF2141 domain-containing protein [Pseudozobellia thermophila]SHI99150.1 Uncharacterized conserved protein, DUF2141 family [Pseudozobellia thermophila]
MKRSALVLVLLLALFGAGVQAQEGAHITLKIENVLSDQGSILASLHTEATFMKGVGVAHAESPAKKGDVSLRFENVKPGTYAVLLIHDSNDNKRMDFDVSGMPVESYGQTGDINLYGPPVFADAKFEVADEDLEFNIRF